MRHRPDGPHCVRAALLVAATLAFAAGCSRGQDSSPATGTSASPPTHPPSSAPTGPLPADHPPVTGAGMPHLSHPKSGAQSTVQVPPEVKVKWKAVQLGVRHRGGQETVTRVAVGGLLAVPQSPRALRVVAFLPAFTSQAGTVTSSSNEPKNPAVLLELTDGRQTLARGWVFQNLPEFNTFDGTDVQVRLLGGLTP